MKRYLTIAIAAVAVVGFGKIFGDLNGFGVDSDIEPHLPTQVPPRTAHRAEMGTAAEGPVQTAAREANMTPAATRVGLYAAAGAMRVPGSVAARPPSIPCGTPSSACSQH